jgi:hypothetical protein
MPHLPPDHDLGIEAGHVPEADARQPLDPLGIEDLNPAEASRAITLA